MPDGERHAPPPEAVKAAAEKLDDLRRKLVDLTARNRFLNFTHRPNARAQLRLVDELPDQVFARLTADKARFRLKALPEPPDEPQDESAPAFRNALAAAQVTDETYLDAIADQEEDDPDSPAQREALRALKDRVREHLGMPAWVHGRALPPAEWARENGVSPGYDLPAPGDFDAPEKHRDGAMQTLMFQDDLARRARGLIADARRLREEKGVDALYLALGFLEWRDGPGEGRPLLAPLLLLPVEIAARATTAGPRFDVTLGPGGVRDNEALRLKLEADFQLALPAFDAEGEDNGDLPTTPEAYFEAIAGMAEKRPGWRVRRYATFAPFTFATLAIHRDLDPANWAATPLEARPLIAGLLAGRPLGDGFDAAEMEDRTDAPAPLVLDADASQYAIVHAAAVAGRDLAVQGPPGTGKSQTIVNLIAAALAQGKRVLFIAEKAAALDVVAKRLADIGLGAFCLDLHGANGRREEVLASLKRRVAMPAGQADSVRLRQALDEARRLKSSLSAYAAAINRQVGKLGHTAHDLIWLEQATRAVDLPEGVDDIDFVAPGEITPYRAEEARGLLRRIADADRTFRESHGAPDRHPWRAMGGARPPMHERPRLVRQAGAWRDALTAVEATDRTWKDAGVEPPAALGGRAAATAAIAALPAPTDGIAGDIFARLGLPESRQALRDYLDADARRQAAAAALARAFEDSATARCHEGLAALAAGLETILGNEPVRELAAVAADRKADAEQWEALASLARDFIAGIAVEAPGGRAVVGGVRRALAAAGILQETPAGFGHWRRSIAADADACQAAADAAARLPLLRRKRRALQEAYGLNLDRLGGLDNILQAENAIRRPGFPAGLFDSAYRDARRRVKAAGMVKGGRGRMAAALTEAGYRRREEAAFANDTALRQRLGAGFVGIETDVEPMLAAARFGDAVRAGFAGHSAAAIAARRALFEADDDRFAAMRQAARGDAFQTLANAAASLENEDPDAPLADLPKRARGNLSHVAGLQTRAAALGLKPDATARDIAAAAEAQIVLAEAEPAMAARPEFGGLDPDVDGLAKTLALAETTAATLAPAPALIAALFVADYAAARTRLLAIAEGVAAALQAEAAARDRLAGYGFDATRPFDRPPASMAATPLRRVAAAAAEAGEDSLNGWIAYRRDLADADAEGFAALLAAFDAAETGLSELPRAYDRALYRSLIREALAADPALAEHRGQRADDMRSRFASIDREIMTLQAQSIAAGLAERKGPAGNAVGRVRDKTERALIEHYAAQKRPRIALRRLFARAPNAIQALKPCLMLSPATVAETLTPGAMHFDLLVVDEASQMKPEFAVGALARAGQAVIVGDEMQLPPTDFFNRSSDDGDDEEDEDAEERVRHESILALANAAFRPERQLLWHYRSRHESLIAFSNQQFYDDRLVVFPAARGAATGGLGVSLAPVENGRYTPGRRVNPAEAEAIVAAAVARMRQSPGRSLGLVAMNLAQRDLIEDMFNRRADGDPAIQAYLDRWRGDGLDPFFVKNLENVQGDERDVILISATYGPDARTGKVMQRFGPITGAAGHRRLNVLFTRARYETQLFASMAAADIRADAKSGPGVHAFKDFLGYAATGVLPPRAVSPPDAHDSPFEVEVARLLARHGFQTTPQVGVAGYRIDLGVTHASFPHGFIAGVECDGAQYHSAAAARDRDRLRQEALERLGWSIVRVWSTDWFEDPAGEARRLVARLEDVARRAAPLLA